MITYGLTGGLGMGKSTVAALLRQQGWTVIDTDDLARDVVRPGSQALAEICAAFGAEMIQPDGTLCRERMADLVFRDSEARTRLESILHPRIRSLWELRVEECRQSGVSRVVVVIPLLFETGAESSFDLTVCVACSELQQQRRLKEGRNWETPEVKRRMAAQISVEEKMARADRVIWNDCDLHVLELQMTRVFE